MGKKVFNAKARQNRKSIIDNSAIKDVKLDLPESSGDVFNGYDDANPLVLPSHRKVAKIHVKQKNLIKILTKKQRKILEAVVDKKKKKEARSDILAALTNVQIPENELQQYTSISRVQTFGVKKLQNIDIIQAKKCQRQQNICSRVKSDKISAIKGAAKRSLLLEEHEDFEAKRKNPNIVGINMESDESDEDEQRKTKEEDEVHEIENKEVIKKTETLVQSNDNANNQSSKRRVVSTCNVSKPAIYIPVHRDPDIQATRLKLPILAEEQQLMEVINENHIVIVAGETGSGKTTQIPQFLYEAGYAEHGKIIGITEPRRVAAIAMSNRVRKEMNLSEKQVSYLIRFEGNVTPETQIKFMTDGVLLKEIESDFLLKKYSVIILDEAHERSVYTDILIGLLSRIVPLRLKRGPDMLKLIIMSATLRVEDFTLNTRLFKSPPPLLNIKARQFPVTVHFQKNTPTDYVAEAFKKTVKIHATLPDGGILIFVTGQQEVKHLVRKLRKAFPCRENNSLIEQIEGGDSQVIDKSHVHSDSDDEFDLKRAIRHIRRSKKKFLSQLSLPKINLDEYKLPGDDTEGDLLEHSNSDQELPLSECDDFDVKENATASLTGKQPLWVLPLYSLLPIEKQNRIFQAPPTGCRLCIVSTNVAETSLTIPNIKYVVDSGRQKTRLYDKVTGVSAFVVTYTSKASANQRAGRAGRVSAGHCYRLYSSAVFNDEFEEFPVPDIQRKPVDDLMLQMRCMGIDRVINFPFPSPPSTEQLQAAERRLIILGALEAVTKPNQGSDILSKVTQLGRAISHFPVAPRFGKMLALSHQQNLLPYTVCLVAALSVQEVLMEATHIDSAQPVNKWQERRMSWAYNGQYQLLGDPMVLLRAVGAAEYAWSKNELTKFCCENGLRLKAISEIRKLRVQLTNEINLSLQLDNLCVDPKMTPPTDAQARFLRQILLAGMGDKVARKVPLSEISDKEERRRLKYAYHCLDMEEPAFMHSSSVLKKKLPEWLIYQEAYEVQNGDTSKMFIRGLTCIDPEWLLIYAPLLCNIGAIKEDPVPRYDSVSGKIYCYVEATFGKAAWELPLSEVEMPMSEKAFCYFAMFFLDAQVCPQLSAFKSKLKATPSAVVKSWSNLNDCILRFKRAFINKQVNTRKKLMDEWQHNPNYLLEEYHNMLYDVSYTELTTLWPTLHN